MDSLTYAISGGGVTVSVTITEVDGALRFDLEVLEDTGTIGDLNALFLDIADESLLSGLSVSGDDVTGSAFEADRVTKIDNFTNVNGEVVKDLGKFDLGVQFGTQGMARDDIQSTSFTLDHAGEDLFLEDFLLQDSALRLTSVGEIGGSRDGSLKLGGTVEGDDSFEEPPVEEPPVEEPPVEEPPAEEPPVEEPPVEEPPMEEPPTDGEYYDNGEPVVIPEDPIEDGEPVEEEPVAGGGYYDNGEPVVIPEDPVEEEPLEQDALYYDNGEPIFIPEDPILEEPSYEAPSYEEALAYEAPYGPSLDTGGDWGLG